MAVALYSMSAIGAAIAQEEGEAQDEPAPRAGAVELFDGQVVVPRPTGWNIIQPGDAALATFRAATDDRAQFEVRASDSVSSNRWERFWRSFDTDLQRAGFEQVSEGRQKTYGTKQGRFFEYELERDDETFRLVVWHTHRRDQAWVFTGFFSASRRDAHTQTFEEMLGEVQWDEQE